MTGLTRKLHLYDYGADVEGLARGCHRYLQTGDLGKFESRPTSVKRMYGPGKAALVKRVLDGRASRLLDRILRDAGAYDAFSDALFEQWHRSQKPPPKPKLVEPRQGFGSLHKSLWESYTIGRQLGLSDLGTYNPASRLPSGRPSDHAVYPAFAFDLGVDPDTGYDNPAGRQFFDRVIGRPEVEYVILGSRIWTRAEGTHGYSGGGHGNHAHLSGRR